MRRQLTATQKKNSHQELNWLASWSWTCHCPELGEINFCCLGHQVYGILLFGNFQQVFIQIYFCPILSSPLKTPIICMLHLVIFSHRLLISVLKILLLSLCFFLNNFYWHVLKFTNSFSCHDQNVITILNELFYVLNFSVQEFPSGSFLIVFISFLKYSTCHPWCLFSLKIL